MAIEKNPLLSLVGGTSMPQQPEFDESELEIEIEDPDDEGMAGINAIAEEDELALQAAQDDHYANLAELIDPQDLAQITGDIIDSYQADKESREEWESTFERGFDLLGLKLQETSEPFEGSCTAVSPLIIEAAVKFQSKASIELFPSGGPVRTQIVGDADKEREDQATRVQDFMNYQFTEQISEYFDEFEKMLFHLPLIGSAFKKMYYDPALRRPCSEFIPIDQFYVSYYASDIQKAERYTQVIHRSITEMERDVKSGMYMDVGLEDPTTPDPTSFTSKIDSIMGISPADDFDQQYVLLEQHCYLDLPEPFSSEDGVALPYVVTVEKQSREIIAIRRNWAKEDETLSKQTYFTHYKFVPGFGFYGLGLIHLLGNMTMSATSALRSLVDAGQFSNLPGGFKARGVRIVGSNDPIAPGEFREVEATGLDLQKSIVPLPYKEPSQTLFNMLTFMTGAGQKFADSTEQIVNESSNYGPVGTTMALIESSAKFFSAIHKRLHKSQRDEFRILSKINFEFLPDEYPYDVPNITTSVFKSDFDGRVDVIPVSDPNIPSAAHRLSMAQMVLQLSSQAPQGMYNIEQVHLSILKAANVQNPDRFFTPKTPPEPHDPITDIDLVVKGMPIQAFPQQDHAAHIAIKTAFIDDPTLGKTEMMAPAVPVLQANIQQHMVMQYQEQISGLMKAETPPGEVSPEVLSQLSINAAEQVLEANMGTAPEDSLENQNLLLESARLDLDQQKLQMTATKDAAELSIKNRELDLKEMGVQLDAAEKVSESEQKKIDARIRDQSSIRTTNAKLTIESLKNLAKERDLMIDKRMNEDRYASGGPVRLAQGGEFFEEFLRGRGGREAFEKPSAISDALEGFFATIGGGRKRTPDEMISDTWESYKFGLRDSDSIEDNEKYQKIIETEQKQDTETPIIDSDLDESTLSQYTLDGTGAIQNEAGAIADRINKEAGYTKVGYNEQQVIADRLASQIRAGKEGSFPEIKGSDWKPQSPGSSDPDALTYVPEGAVDREVDPNLEIDLTPEGVDIGAAGLEIVNTPVTLPKPIQPVTLDQELIDPTTYATDVMDAYGYYSEADNARLDKNRDIVQKRIREQAMGLPSVATKAEEIDKRAITAEKDSTQDILNTLRTELGRTEAAKKASNLKGDQRNREREKDDKYGQRSIKIDQRTGELKPADWVQPIPTPPRLEERSPEKREGEIDLQEVVGKNYKAVPENVAPAELKPSIAGSTPPQIQTFQPEPGSLPLQEKTPFKGVTRVFERVSQAIPEVQKSQFKRSKFNMKNLDKFNKNANPEDVVAQFEKFKENRYFATKYEEKQGISTVGYGDTQSGKDSVTKEQAKVDLAKRLKKVGKDIDKLIKVPLSKNQRTAIISLVDNVGLGSFKNSNALKALNNGNFDEFYNQAFSFENGWVNQNGKPLKGLVRRRASEGNLFNLA